MISGLVGAGYGFFVVFRYAIHEKAVTPIFGETPMAFTTATLAVIYGLAIFWDGWLTRERAIQRPPSREWTTHQVLQLIMAVISALTMIITALIGTVRYN